VADPLRVYWQPGCSSCVKVKEFLARLDVPFVSVNILDEPEARQELVARGVRSVPVLIRGEEMIFAQSLKDVAAFVGKSVHDTHLPAAELMGRWRYFLATARGLIAQIPPEHLETRPIAKRDRSVCQLSYHIFQIPDSFLQAVESGLKDTRDVSNAMLDHLKTVPDLLNYADSVIARHDRWWAAQDDKTYAFRMHTYYGEQDADQVIERSTWHSAQHTRQLDYVLGSEVRGLHGRLDIAKFDGLPMPDGLWQ